MLVCKQRGSERDRLPLVLCVCVYMCCVCVCMCVCVCVCARKRKRGALMNAIDLCLDDFMARKTREKLMNKQQTRRADGLSFRRQNG